MLMLKAVSFAVGAHAANNMDGQYETLDKSKVYKTEINGETKVVVETTNGKLYCNSTADALTFLNQSMAVETMMKSAETTKPESEFEWAQKTAVTGENSKGTVTPMSDNYLFIQELIFQKTQLLCHLLTWLFQLLQVNLLVD